MRFVELIADLFLLVAESVEYILDLAFGDDDDHNDPDLAPA